MPGWSCSRSRSAPCTASRWCRPITVWQQLAEHLDHLATEKPRVLVGIDGPDAAGKTTSAGRLAGLLRTPVVLASVDAFHRPRAARTRRGELSPRGYYEDAFDTDRLVSGLLEPFAAGAPEVLSQVHDLFADATADVVTAVPPRAVLIVDGVFLLRPGLRHHWSYAVYLHVPEEESLARALVRDRVLLGGEDSVRERYAARYLPAQALYRAEVDPVASAELVIDNTDPSAPRVLAGSFAATGEQG